MKSYDSVELQQMYGQELISSLKDAQVAFRQEEQYVNAIEAQYQYLAELEKDKGIWSIVYAAKHPSKWVIAVIIVISIAISAKYMTAKQGDMLIPCLMVIFAFPGLGMLYGMQMSMAANLLKKKIKKVENQNGIALLFPVLCTVAITYIMGFGWCVILYGLVGIYEALCWVDIKLLNKNKHRKKQNKHFRKKDEAAALELGWRMTRLNSFAQSNEMRFARALVPQAFQSSYAVGELLSVMEKYAVYDLHTGIQNYYQEKHMQKMEMEAEAQRRAQEQAAAEQRAQTEILEWQRRDNQWHNKEMRYQQERANEEANATLRDMYREQREHNREVERYFYR